MGDGKIGEAAQDTRSPRSLGQVTNREPSSWSPSRIRFSTPLASSTPSSRPGTAPSQATQALSPQLTPLTKPIVAPEAYNGQGSYKDWFTHFEACKTINAWTEAQACQFLAVKLKGTALRVYSDLTPTERLDYKSVTSALKSRFDPERDVGVYWAQLRGKTRKKGESLSELAGYFQRIAARAYPDSDQEHY